MSDNVEKDPEFILKKNDLDLAEKEAGILKAAASQNTIDAMVGAVRHFTQVWGGSLPCTDVNIKNYLITYAGELSLSTLEQRRVLIGRWHKENGLDYNPNNSDLVRKIMRGIRKKYHQEPKQARPIAIRVLEKVIVHLDGVVETRLVAVDKITYKRSSVTYEDSVRLRAIRDKAMLLTAFWFGLRSDELVNVQVRHLKFHWEADIPYFELYLPRSKTDKKSQGTSKKLNAIQGNKCDLCPMQALQDWLDILCNGVVRKSFLQSEAPAFSKVTRWGKIYDTNIKQDSINNLFRKIFDESGLDAEDYSSHSMRRGLANWIIETGASLADLMSWVGWKDTRTAMRYVDGRNSLPTFLLEKEEKSFLRDARQRDIESSNDS